MRKEELELKTKGFTKSFYITRHDIDFYLALSSMLRERGTQVSTFVMFCLKYVVLNDGNDFFDDFKKHYGKLIEGRLEEMIVKYKGKKMKLSELIDSELMKEGGFIKI